MATITVMSFNVIVAKQNSKYEKLEESILYKPPPSTLRILKWEKFHEDTAKSYYINEKMTTHGNFSKVVTIGIYVCVIKSWLATYVPDDLVEDPSESPDQRHGLL